MADVSEPGQQPPQSAPMPKPPLPAGGAPQGAPQMAPQIAIDRPDVSDEALDKRLERAGTLMLLAIATFVVLLVTWAGFAELDTVTRGVARIVPSGHLQVVQNLEGGIVRDILTSEGEVVKKGQIILRLDDTQFDSAFRRHSKESSGLEARMARLEAETKFAREIDFPDRVVEDAPEAVRSEESLFRARRADYDAALNVRLAQRSQRQQALGEAEAALASAGEAEALALQEYDMVRPLVESGAESRMTLLRAEQRLNDARGQLSTLGLSVKQAKDALREIQNEIGSLKQNYLTRAAEELGKLRLELETLAEEGPALQDKVARREVRSPVDGIINRLHVQTVGGVVQPGMPLVEVVPLDDNLYVEAQIRPEDIAFLAPGQEARVKVTAYDYTRYGVLEGAIQHISADAVTNEQGETYYIARIRTDGNHLTGAPDMSEDEVADLRIIPGMVAQVDILTGKRSVLNYVVRPLIKTRDSAFRE